MSTQTRPSNYKQYSRSKIREQAAEYRRTHPIPEKKKRERSAAEQFVSITIRLIIVLIIITIIFHKEVKTFFDGIIK